ncbi:rod shape-determining protein MreC [bacterium]|nr:rod shape-determining protein MreC [bacterium]
MAEFIEKKKTMFVFFSLIFVSVLFMSLRLDSEVGIVRNVIFYVFSATPEYIDNVLKQSQGVTERIYSMGLIYKENIELKKDIQRFIKKEIYFEKLRLENKRLEEIVQYESNLSYRKQVVARMIGREPNSWYNAIVINKGTKDGISKDDIVITYQQGREGVIGRVIESSFFSSKVLLITDNNSAIAAYIKRNKEDGLIEGQNQESLVMKYLSSKADVRIGDQIVTSGYGGVFPGQILIGEVKNVLKENSSEHFRRALISPAINFNRISDVLVIKR